jgi:hypothetical protein
MALPLHDSGVCGYQSVLAFDIWRRIQMQILPDWNALLSANWMIGQRSTAGYGHSQAAAETVGHVKKCLSTMAEKRNPWTFQITAGIDLIDVVSLRYRLSI